MTIYKCDKCNKEMESRMKIHISGPQVDPVIKVLAEMDLCPNCFHSIYDKMDEFVTKRGDKT